MLNFAKVGVFFLLALSIIHAIDGRTCHVLKGYQTLDKLNQNKDNPDHSKQCNSTQSACFAFTGFGDDEEYPFEQGHGTQTNGTIAKGQIDNQCESLEFACSSFGNGSLGRDCVPNSYLCDGDDDCQDGSDEQLEFCASRYSNEEFGHSDCMEGEIFEQAAGLVHFFQGLVGGRRRRRYDFYDMPVSNTKANVNISLSGARLTGLASTDFKMVEDRRIRGEPQDAKVDLIVKIDDFTVKLRLEGDYTNTYKAFEKLFSRDIFRNYRNYRSDLFEILDAFDGTIDIVEQSIIGDVKGAYKKVKSLAKWMFVNIENQFGFGSPRGEDREWTTYGEEKINVDIKLKLNVGNENTADIKFKGELSEAAKEFVTNGYLAALNAKMEFCDDNKKCTRMKICGKDLCNTF